MYYRHEYEDELERQKKYRERAANQPDQPPL